MRVVVVECPGRNGKRRERHYWQSIVVNMQHIWQCRYCGLRRNPGQIH